MTIEEIFAKDRSIEDVISILKEKSITIPEWSTLLRQYDTDYHPVNNRSLYPDVVEENGKITKVSRVTYNWQKLATKRMTELCFAIPVKRVYSPLSDNEQEAANLIERIYERNSIDSINIDRGVHLFAGCEVMTLWYAVEDQNNYYGVPSKLKIRCKNFSPMNGEELYPIFDDYGDYIAMSVKYSVTRFEVTTTYFDTYTSNRHIKFKYVTSWEIVVDEPISIQKNPTLYMYRDEPIWENSSDKVYEMEWAISRNGNYLRKNSKPAWVVCADEETSGEEEGDVDSEFMSVLQYPKGSTAKYETWEQAIENLKFYTTEMKSSYFSSLQLPNWSYEDMKNNAMSGESRKQLFIDSQLKVIDESGVILSFLNREINVVKAFAKVILPARAKEIDSLQVKNVITPYTITDVKDVIDNITSATGGKAIMSQREGVQQLGISRDIDKTMQEIAADETLSIGEPTI